MGFGFKENKPPDEVINLLLVPASGNVFLGVGEIAGFGEDDNPLQKGCLYPYNGRTEACRAKWELPLNKHQVADDAVGDKDTCMAEAQVLVFRFQFAASYVRFGGVYAMLP